MATQTFPLKQAVVPESLKGTEITYETPEAVAGDLEATLDNLRRFVDPEADFPSVLVAKFNGQGFNLDIQKFLVDQSREEGATAESLQQAAQTFRVGAPRRTSGGREGKMKQAERKAAEAVNTALDMYRALNKRQRTEWRDRILALGAATPEQLDEIDTEG